ncbi:hypothetical protein [Archangium sp.]|jgi:hypothetical protein|uniref:hypothetical protein n=1 Tax=Archangium sp. TaxID=1872627 RepID=UPI002EDB028F
MNRNLLRLGVCAGVTLFALQALAAGPGFLERLGKLLGLDKRAMGSLSRPRSCERPAGAYLMRLDCATGTESVLWHCEGCRSPLQAGDAGIVVIREDGLWLVEAPEKARRLVEGSGFSALLGLTPGSARHLVVVRERTDGGVPLIGLADLGSGGFSEAATQPTTQEEVNALRTLQPATVKGTQELSTIEPARQLCGPRQLRVTEPGAPKRKLCEFQPVADGGTWDRFDPAWSGDKVIYVAGPLSGSRQ